MQMIIQSMPPAPAIVIITSEAARQIMVVVEKEILIECHDMATALLDLISAYFSFDQNHFILFFFCSSSNILCLG